MARSLNLPRGIRNVVDIRDRGNKFAGSIDRKNLRSISSENKSSSFEHCVDLVRKYDYENYLCTLLLPRDVRNHAFVLRAFNVEIAQMRDMVSKADIGYMRVNFWKDAIERVFAGNPPMQPIAIQLFKLLEEKKLSKTWFLNLIKSREEAMADKGLLTLGELELYAEKTVSSMYYLILQAAGVSDVQCDHAASHLGKSQGITNTLRSIPFNASRNRPSLPLQIMSKYKISQEQLRRGSLKDSFQNAVLEVSSTANHHLKLCKGLLENLPKDVKPIFLPIVPVSRYLQSLEKIDFDVFHPKLQHRSYGLPFRLLLHKVTNRY